eukprot:snap_masked-scaffold_3-processed-gene-21.32-mRNA-1 protein AED:1.00 eAED:1.00 QI:0/0/0/0/1/1/2/0/233
MNENLRLVHYLSDTLLSYGFMPSVHLSHASQSTNFVLNFDIYSLQVKVTKHKARNKYNFLLHNTSSTNFREKNLVEFFTVDKEISEGNFTSLIKKKIQLLYKFTPTLDLLPQPLLVEICTFLKLKDFVSVLAVNYNFLKLQNNNYIWRMHCLEQSKKFSVFLFSDEKKKKLEQEIEAKENEKLDKYRTIYQKHMRIIKDGENKLKLHSHRRGVRLTSGVAVRRRIGFRRSGLV